jgi:hypothetical protein
VNAKRYTDLAATLFALTGQGRDGLFIHRPFVDFTGSLEGGILLSQLLYWTPRARIELPETDGSQSTGWIAKTDANFSEELFLTKYSLRKARQSLEKMGVLETRRAKFAGAPTVHYRLLIPALTEAWVAWCHRNDDSSEVESSPDRDQPIDSSKSQNRFCDTGRSYTETPSETTPPPRTPDSRDDGGGEDDAFNLPQAVRDGLHAIGYRNHPAGLREVSKVYAEDPDLVRGWLAELRENRSQYNNRAGFFRKCVLRQRTPLLPERVPTPSPSAQCPRCQGTGWVLRADGLAAPCGCASDEQI